MKNTFNGWIDIGKLDINVVADYIVTGKSAKEANPVNWAIDLIGNTKTNLKILDFGCGFGRNTFYIADTVKNWEVFGYDNKSMISRSGEFYNIKYGNELPKNAIFEDNWDVIKNQKFDVIFCCLVLQHIYESTLIDYVTDFKKMTNRLIVGGRRFNDDMVDGKYKNTWGILENCGLYPKNSKEINYSKDGPDEGHMICIYDTR